MAKEDVTILRLSTGEAVKSIADLRENISTLKNVLKDLEIGSNEYKDALTQLNENQAALKNAMYATSSSMEDVAKAAKASTLEYDEQNKLINANTHSYNELVKAMADLKTEYRSTTDLVKRDELVSKIGSINDELKRLDAAQGNFQRNVGNYAGSIKQAWSDMTKDLAEKTDSFRKGLGAVGGGLGGMKDGLEGISKSPAVATIGILVSVFMKLAEHIKEDENAMASIKKAMDGLKPVMEFLSGILDKVVDYLVELAEKVIGWLGSSGILNKVVAGVMGVGNAIVQYVISPFKGVIAAIKVFQDEGIKGIRNAAKAFGSEMKSGLSFRSNFQAGQLAADAMIAGSASRRKETEKAGKDMAKSMTEGAESALKDWEKALAEGDRVTAAARKQREELQKLLDDIGKDLDAITDAEIEGIENEISESLLAQAEMYAQANEQALEAAEKRKEIMQLSIGAASDLFSSIADLLEADEKNGKKNAQKVKGLRIASATIDTISGAVGAFASAARDPGGIPGMIIGAANAATITATGVANIAKIKATDVGGSSDGSGSVAVSAPSIPLSIPEVRTLTTASDETRLNEMIDDVQVYVLESDIQAKSNGKKVRVKESSF